MFIWSLLHGYASIEQSNVMQHLVLSKGVQANARDFMMTMIHSALQSNRKEDTKK
jgi:hypothetical protein